MADHLSTLRIMGVPYTDEEIAKAKADLASQATPDADHGALLKRYPKAAAGDFDGQPGRLTEMDALVAYLQVLGRMVDFTAVRTEDLQAIGGGPMAMADCSYLTSSSGRSRA